MELHCSQTVSVDIDRIQGLRPLWNYTALKLNDFTITDITSLRPLWNYTALKRCDCPLRKLIV